MFASLLYVAVRRLLQLVVLGLRSQGVKDEVEQTGVALLGDYEGHPSIRSMIGEGYEVVTF